MGNDIAKNHLLLQLSVKMDIIKLRIFEIE